MLPKPVLLAISALILATFACQAVSQSSRNSEKQSASLPQESKISGEQVFQHMGCNQCHKPVLAVAAPSLVGLYGSQVELEGGETVTADEAYLRESILSPRAKIVAGYQPIMPENYSSRLGDEEVEALIEYIRLLGD